MTAEDAVTWFLRKKDQEFNEFIEELFSEEDATFYYYTKALLFKIYEMDRTGRHMTKMQACRYIPSQHSGTCRKYVDIAESRGFIALKKNPKDKRRVDVIPNDQLRTWAKNEIDREVKAARDVYENFHEADRRNA